ncbi:MAG TPA: hypothetical protein PLI09_28510 [Candidatus Hydrogenedentes bacterium]|nr:hypothetical protein [Candidatus Hydrogenedentota bacterium]
MTTQKILLAGCVLLLCSGAIPAFAQEPAANDSIPENVYRGELLRFPGPWSFTLGKAAIILVTDDELIALSNPDQVINLSLTFDKVEKSLRQICEEAKAAGHRTLVFSFDHFFSQYRPGQEGKPRKLTPDTGEYIQRIAAISQFAQQYGLGLELSLMSPLEIGPAYAAQTGESGLWMHYRKGIRDPKTGAYSVQLWRQRRWANNKGPLAIDDAGIRVFAFFDQPLHGTPYRMVNPGDILEITEGVQAEVSEGTARTKGDYNAVWTRIYGSGHPEAGERNRVLVVQQYKTPEMDYLSENALPYLKKLGDMYAGAGVKLNGLYADEMHIQQDWGYFNHHDHGEFALRYVSPGLAKAFAAKYGPEYADFAKYLIYFVHGQEDFANDLSAKQNIMHVFGPTSDAIQATALFRARYYHFLQDGVVDLFVAAKRHLEQRMGYKLESRAHATWAESPTIDKWDVGQEPHPQNQYEYTSNFVWSDTVHQAASACYDYFKWGDFLTGNGNDHPEGGWLDRNYWALALACSTGILNDIPYSYCGHWGMPGDISRRRSALVNTFGDAAWPPYGMVEGMVHRDTGVLMLYPIDLVAMEERFGSWMTQYGYANYITQAKLLERGKVNGNAIEVAGRRFTTLATTFEPFPAKELLDMMRAFAEQGGRIVWSGPPPLLFQDGSSALATWQDLFGVEYAPTQTNGLIAPGKHVIFKGDFKEIVPMTILTDFLVDHIYPVIPRQGSDPVASVKQHIVGVHRTTANNGCISYWGFRPRNDQSGSLGYKDMHWFEILSTLGAYPSTGAFPNTNDNPDFTSQTTDFLACRFPNGAIAIAPHLIDIEENWPGGFARKPGEDKKIMEKLNLPADHLTLSNIKIAGKDITYEGNECVAFRTNDNGDLLAFAGKNCSQLTVNGHTSIFADQPMPFIAWAPVEDIQKVENGAVLQMFFAGTGKVRIPLANLPSPLQVVAQGPTPGSKGEIIPSTTENGALVFDVPPSASHRWIFAVPAQ